ncbi:hypothetical protein [Asticcacaulis sp. AC402]|uniref:hypothetical protein n=1 Tax=Asticcacaulis sp. AC402 TaxID=1282361 RepID=UPI0012DFA6D7|nr:hypothetical protein [Asticcacaulis sp. AC402]
MFSLFGLPIGVIGIYLIVVCRRIFVGRRFWTLFVPWHLFLIFVMPVLLYGALVLAFYTRLMIDFGLSFL